MDNKSKAQKIRDYMKDNPNATSNEIASACSVRTQHVHQVKYNLKRMGGKHPRSYRMSTLVKNVEPQIVNAKRSPEETKISNHDFRVMVDAMADMSKKVVELEHDVIGYKAVISFLEHQIGLRRDNRGASV